MVGALLRQEYCEISLEWINYGNIEERTDDPQIKSMSDKDESRPE
jgi:hypothetical protein